jgi:hypothetical protein
MNCLIKTNNKLKIGDNITYTQLYISRFNPVNPTRKGILMGLGKLAYVKWENRKSNEAIAIRYIINL